MRMPDWAPLWSKIVDSSLWSEPDYVVKIFLTLLAKKDWNNVVMGSAYNIAQWARKDEATVIEALKILAAPDTKRLEPQPFDGRRIERVDGGWLILNGKYYQDLVRSEKLKDQKAKWAAIDREAEKQAREILKDKIGTMSLEEFEKLLDSTKKILKTKIKGGSGGKLAGETMNQKLTQDGATQEDLDKHSDSFLPSPENDPEQDTPPTAGEEG